jgi:hypothetical protein
MLLHVSAYGHHQGAHTMQRCGNHMLPHRCIVHNDVLLPNILTTVTLARLKYELPDDGRRPKHVAAF